jgi:Zn-dependent protease
MFSHHALELGTVAGIRVVVHRAWFVFFIGLTAWLAQFTFPQLFPNWSHGEHWLLATLLVLGESATGFVHELGHSVVAVAKHRRVHSITLYGFVAATRRGPSPTEGCEAALIALAGPLTHLILASMFWAAYLMLPGEATIFSTAAALLALLNVGIGVLNLLPIAPLDGGRAFLALAGAVHRTSAA